MKKMWFLSSLLLFAAVTGFATGAVSPGVDPGKPSETEEVELMQMHYPGAPAVRCVGVIRQTPVIVVVNRCVRPVRVTVATRIGVRVVVIRPRATAAVGPGPGRLIRAVHL